MLHFRTEPYQVGDVHPLWLGDTCAMYFLRPKGVVDCIAVFDDPDKVVCDGTILTTTKDFLHWQWRELPRMAVGIYKHEGHLRSCVAASPFDGKIVQSNDGVHFSDTGHIVPSNQQLYPQGLRDQLVFWDEDIRNYRVVALSYTTNGHNDASGSMDCAISIATASNQDTRLWQPQHPLVHFPNTGLPLMEALEPEVPQMFKLNDRWILLASLARQSIHWVGAPSCYVGQPGVGIDQQTFTLTQQLDGEDLCAAQVVAHGGSTYLFGWIPLNPFGQEWGGHLNFPREIYWHRDGFIASKLNAAFFARIQGAVVAAGVPVGTAIQTKGFSYGIDISIPAGLRSQLSAQLYSQQPLFCKVDMQARTAMICTAATDGTPFIFAQTTLPATSEALTHIRILVDEDIVEVFFGDFAVLTARVSCRANSECVTIATDDSTPCSTNYYPLQGACSVEENPHLTLTHLLPEP